MEKDDFINVFWEYYFGLENDFIFTIRYVSITESNYKTYSTEYAKLLLSICSEVDVILKKICDFEGSKMKNVNDYLQKIIKKELMEKNNKVTLKSPHSKLTLTPFDRWKETKNLSWWTDYNKVKHNRSENIEKANLKNVLTSLSALYLLENYLYQKIIKDEVDVIDFIEPPSKLFSLNWDAKMKSIENMHYTIVGQIEN
ncbi:hypothetical protein RAK27_17070 [Carnobacterium maltaromaticum]|uniref:ApeA N-terminal domain-containing protein n=1 Tax=Carnobacterium maltaromaticum TaxID=2751 RepID=A0AAW9JXK6_CARML|nr:hypothetical protein [Carnobacterium maltaromaticum]MDZ5760353.1 hypothetical protein [Carnobacterium maltaromaticum]